MKSYSADFERNQMNVVLIGESIPHVIGNTRIKRWVAFGGK